MSEPKSSEVEALKNFIQSWMKSNGVGQVYIEVSQDEVEVGVCDSTLNRLDSEIGTNLYNLIKRVMRRFGK